MPLRERQEVQELPRGVTLRASPRRAAAVLAAVAFANLAVAVLHFGLAAAAPLLRTELGLGTAGIGLLLSAPPLGLMLGTFVWGELADRLSERRVLTAAFVGFTASCLGASLAAGPQSLPVFGTLLLAAGAFGSAAHSAGGRAISAVFPPERHGLVLAIRHTAIPLGGAAGGVLVPSVAATAGLGAAVRVVVVLGALAAAGVALVIPSSRLAGAAPREVPGPSPVRHRPLWLLAIGASSLAFVQLGVGSFLTLHLVEEAGISLAAAAAVFAATQLLGAIGRVALGFWSDRVASRIGMLRAVAVVTALLVGASAASGTDRAEGALLAAALVVVTSCNGVVVAAAASLAPAGRTGATLGMQTTFNAAACTIAPIILGAVLAAVGWSGVQAVLLAALALSLGCLGRLTRIAAA